jgi:hypothetical protein
MRECEREDWIVRGSGISISALDIRWFWEAYQFAG